MSNEQSFAESCGSNEQSFANTFGSSEQSFANSCGSNKQPYEQLAILPMIVAKSVCETVYRGTELSVRVRSGDQVAKTEALRLEMMQTPGQMIEFAQLADDRCKAAYEHDADWFMKCVRSENGRDQLFVWISHWLAAYLNSPETFKQASGVV